MKDKILEIVNSKPKHFSRMIKNDNELYDWIMNNTHLTDDDRPFVEHIRSALYNETNICEFGNIKKFKDIKVGFGFCGRARNCECCKNSVSRNVSEKLTSKTDEEISKMVEKRKKTNLEKYGVDNVGKTEKARENHRRFYDDEGLVEEAVEKYKQTNLDRYGVENPQQRNEIREKTKKTNLEKYGVENPQQNKEIQEKTKQTNLERYGVENTFQSPEFKEKLKQTNTEKYGVEYTVYKHLSKETIEILNDKEKFSEFIKDKSAHYIAKELGIHRGSFYEIVKKYDVHELYLKKGPSYLETEMREFLDELNINYQINNRSVLNGYELDFYIPDHNLAIEMNGVYWHSDEYISDKNYHYNKWKWCFDKEIHLISIFEDDWNLQKDKIKNIIKTNLEINSKEISENDIYIKKIDENSTRIFMEKYHLNGFSNGIHFGAFDGDILISAMTFNYIQDQNYELSRFEIDNNYSQIEIFKKILKYAQKDLKFDEVVSFSDNTCFTGGVYEKCGFELVQIIDPDYRYLYNGKRVHKSNFKKADIKKKFPEIAELIDDGITEKQSMDLIGIPRIYDCGKCEWVWKSE